MIAKNLFKKFDPPPKKDFPYSTLVRESKKSAYKKSEPKLIFKIRTSKY